MYNSSIVTKELVAAFTGMISTARKEGGKAPTRQIGFESTYEPSALIYRNYV